MHHESRLWVYALRNFLKHAPDAAPLAKAHEGGFGCAEQQVSAWEWWKAKGKGQSCQDF